MLEKIAAGFLFTEGPIWNVREGSLRFSDIHGNKIYKWTPQHGVSVFRDPSGNSNGLTLDREGRLIACEHGNRRVSRTNGDGIAQAVATHYEGKRLNSPNDVVVKSDGTIYFTDPPYGLKRQTEGKELTFNGVYRLSPDSGQLTLLVDDFKGPNGLCFSPDENTLYVDDSERQHVRSFDVRADGTLTGGKVFAELDTSIGRGNADGMKVDTGGNLFVTGAGGVWVFSPAGERLGILLTPEVPTNVAWGGPDEGTLYITATTSVYRIRLQVSGSIPAA